MPETRNSSALAMELHLSCTNPSIYKWINRQNNTETWVWSRLKMGIIFYIYLVTSQFMIVRFNSLRLNDTIWCQKFFSIGLVTMLVIWMLPNHYLDQSLVWKVPTILGCYFLMKTSNSTAKGRWSLELRCFQLHLGNVAARSHDVKHRNYSEKNVPLCSG